MDHQKRVLVTGGAGYIGSHTLVALIEAGYQPIVVDNLSNSVSYALFQIEKMMHCAIPFHCLDLQVEGALDPIFEAYSIESVVHFAGLKAVGESVHNPILYYANNVGGTLNLLKAMQKAGVHHLVFSSSASVYGRPTKMPIEESAPLQPASPYGETKRIVEGILADMVIRNPHWKVAMLRYFNPVGAHPSGMIGEDPKGVPNNLMPYLTQVAVGTYPTLRVFGRDYPTQDGTCIRDYVHVMDLAEAHVAALGVLSHPHARAPLVVNVGTGKGSSVLELIETFEQASGVSIPIEWCDRRDGDVPSCFAGVSLAETVLGWQAKRTLFQMCEDAWRWQSSYPHGYAFSK